MASVRSDSSMMMFLAVVRWLQFEATLLFHLFLKGKTLFMQFFLHHEHLYIVYLLRCLFNQVMRVKLYRRSMEDIVISHVPELCLRLMCLMGLTIIVSSLFSNMPFATPLISPFASALSFLFFNCFAVSIHSCMSVASYSIMRKSSIVIGLFPSAS